MTLSSFFPSNPNSFFSNTSYSVSLLLILSILFEAFFLVATEMIVECDALMFYDYAKFLFGTEGAFTQYRTPGFPLFLLFTGQLYLDTYLITIAVHAVMAISAPILLYHTLLPFNKKTALIAALTFIATTTPFAYSKAILPQQLMI